MNHPNDLFLQVDAGKTCKTPTMPLSHPNDLFLSTVRACGCIRAACIWKLNFWTLAVSWHFVFEHTRRLVCVTAMQFDPFCIVFRVSDKSISASCPDGVGVTKGLFSSKCSVHRRKTACPSVKTFHPLVSDAASLPK